jgi:hypothetical protein
MGNIYLIELYNNNERFFKIGITVHRYCRFYEIMKSGYQVNILYMAMGYDYSEALTLESNLQSMFTPYRPTIKFGGYRECFSSVDLEEFKAKTKLFPHKEIMENIAISWR